jgi:hypothetical protein
MSSIPNQIPCCLATFADFYRGNEVLYANKNKTFGSEKNNSKFELNGYYLLLYYMKYTQHTFFALCLSSSSFHNRILGEKVDGLFDYRAVVGIHKPVECAKPCLDGFRRSANARPYRAVQRHCERIAFRGATRISRVHKIGTLFQNAVIHTDAQREVKI